MSDRFFRLLIRIGFPARPYYWLLDRLTDNNGWRPLGWVETGGATVAHLCQTCDTQLPAEWKP